MSRYKKAKILIESYIKNPSLLDEMRENTKQFDKNKNGADEIADYIIKCLFEDEEKQALENKNYWFWNHGKLWYNYKKIILIFTNSPPV